MVEYKIIFLKLADKDKNILKQADLENKAKGLLDLSTLNPYQTPPTYEKLRGNLDGCCSWRVNYQHRLVYEIDETRKEIFVLRMWTHYNNYDILLRKKIKIVKCVLKHRH